MNNHFFRQVFLKGKLREGLTEQCEETHLDKRAEPAGNFPCIIKASPFLRQLHKASPVLKCSLSNRCQTGQTGPEFCAHQHRGTGLEWQNQHHLALLTPAFTDPIFDGQVAPFALQEMLIPSSRGRRSNFLPGFVLLKDRLRQL